MRSLEGARYRVISDCRNFFHSGEVVIALEDSFAPYCVREEKYVPGCKIEDLNFDDYSPILNNSLEMLEDQPYLKD